VAPTGRLPVLTGNVSWFVCRSGGWQAAEAPDDDVDVGADVCVCGSVNDFTFESLHRPTAT